MPSRGVGAPTAAHRTMVSPYRITQDPSACLATRPTSTVRSRSPTAIFSFKYFFTVIFGLLVSGGKRRHAASHPLRVDWNASVSLAPFDRKQAGTLALQSKKEKAAEPGREALPPS